MLTGFLEYERSVSNDVEEKQRIKNFNEFLPVLVLGGFAAAYPFS